MTPAEVEDIVIREMISWELPPDRLKIKTGSFNPSKDISAEEVAAFRSANPNLFDADPVSFDLPTPNLFNKIYLLLTGWTLVPTRYAESKNPDKRAPSAIFVVHNCGANHLFH